jgi:proline dehydrogenase
LIRQGLLWLSEQGKVFDFVRSNTLARSFAARFVAGETIDEGVAAARALAPTGITTSLDLLGESVKARAEAEAARDEYLTMLDRLAAAPGVEVNVSVKLTQMGLDLDPELCFANMSAILERAKTLGGFVRLDMESSEYTDRTLAMYERLHPQYGAHCGVVIQSMLRRSEADVERLLGLRARVRLCKGAYLEPPSVAFPDKQDVDQNYVRLMHRLMQHGNYPGLATHDVALIDEARRFAGAAGIASDRYEFQMLYGVRRDLQEQLVREGQRIRVYVPFGTQWYPYLMRRLAERPANIAFMAGNIVKEALPGR